MRGGDAEAIECSAAISVARRPALRPGDIVWQERRLGLEPGKAGDHVMVRSMTQILWNANLLIPPAASRNLAVCRQPRGPFDRQSGERFS